MSYSKDTIGALKEQWEVSKAQEVDKTHLIEKLFSCIYELEGKLEEGQLNFSHQHDLLVSTQEKVNHLDKKLSATEMKLHGRTTGLEHTLGLLAEAEKELDDQRKLISELLDQVVGEAGDKNQPMQDDKLTDRIDDEVGDGKQGLQDVKYTEPYVKILMDVDHFMPLKEEYLKYGEDGAIRIAKVMRQAIPQTLERVGITTKVSGVCFMAAGTAALGEHIRMDLENTQCKHIYFCTGPGDEHAELLDELNSNAAWKARITLCLDDSVNFEQLCNTAKKFRRIVVKARFFHTMPREAIGDDVPSQPHGMSEKARGKMPAGPATPVKARSRSPVCLSPTVKA